MTARCCCHGKHKEDNSVNEADLKFKKRTNGMRFRCIRRFLAITCSQIGLIIFLIGYLIGGSFLFSYLERANQQERLNKEIMDIKNTFSQLTGGDRFKRSIQEDMRPIATRVSLSCVDLQIQALEHELNQLNQIIGDPRLQLRLEELKQFREDVSELMFLDDASILEGVLAAKLEVNLTSLINRFEALLRPKKPKIIEDDQIDSQSLVKLVRSIYEAVKAGWIPPKDMEGLTMNNIGALKPRARPGDPNSDAFLKGRIPRSDPWTLSGSLFFAITVVTTIGYGQVVPVTKYGRLATIFYGLIGIPMTLLFLTNLGSLMADVFRILYKRLCCCCISPKRSSPEPTPSSSGSRTPHEVSRKSSGTISLRANPGRILPLPRGSKNSALQQLVQKTAPLPGGPTSLFESLVGTDSVFTRARQVRQESRNIQVPVSLILVIFALYLLLGAVIFSYWENWSLLDSMYFVFVTLSTIGFGDMLPGDHDPRATDRLYKFITSNVYLVVGLAMVAMCFDLIQLEIKRKSKGLAKKIGIISSV